MCDADDKTGGTPIYIKSPDECCRVLVTTVVITMEMREETLNEIEFVVIDYIPIWPF